MFSFSIAATSVNLLNIPEFTLASTVLLRSELEERDVRDVRDVTEFLLVVWRPAEESQ